MIELIATISTVILIAGVVLNNRRKRLCFVFWLAAALLTFGIDLAVHIRALAFRDAILALLAVEGWFRWKRQPADERTVRRMLARESEMRKRAVDIAKKQISARNSAEQARHVCQHALMNTDNKIAAVNKFYWTAVAQLKRCIRGMN